MKFFNQNDKGRHKRTQKTEGHREHKETKGTQGNITDRGNTGDIRDKENTRDIRDTGGQKGKQGTQKDTRHKVEHRGTQEIQETQETLGDKRNTKDIRDTWGHRGHKGTKGQKRKQGNKGEHGITDSNKMRHSVTQGKQG